MPLRQLSVLLAGLAVWVGSVSAAPADDPIDFQRDIRPILSDNCFLCHGPDDGTREASLRLDRRDDAIKPADSGERAIVPGDPAASELVRRITSDDADLRMPPAASGKSLKPEQIDLLKRWIAEGANYRTHWAFIAPKRPAVPAVKNTEWPQNEIDRFILARLEKDGLAPSLPAAKETLLRRLSLDLIGLPPTLAELDAFLADPSPDAYGKQVERLLRSPHYGERWGRHWLDAARYADSDGFEKDKPRTVWMYRDWVVDALNRDLPYDQFLIEQIAGDLLANATQDQRVATGYLRNSMINEEGGVDPEQFRMEAMFDRMDAIGKGILGLTIQCSQCHTHKYDPISHEDYYRVFAYLNDTQEASIATYTDEELAQRAEILRQIAEIEQGLRHRAPDWPARMAQWEETVRGNQPAWQVLKITNAGDNAQRYIYHDDGSQTAWGYAPTKWTSKFSGKIEQPQTITAIRLETLTDSMLPLGGPGRSPQGLFALSEFLVEVTTPDAPDKPQRVKLATATADFSNAAKPLDAMFDDKTKKERITGPVDFAIDGKDETAWGIDAGPGRRNVDRQAVFVLEKPLELAAGSMLTFQFKQMHGGWNSDDNQNNNLGRFRVSLTGAESAAADPLPHNVREGLTIEPQQRSPEQTAAIFSTWRTTVPEWKDVNEQIEALWRQHPVGASQLVLAERDMHRPSFVLARGDFLKPTKPVEPGVLSALHPLPSDAPKNRLGLARWLASRESPTTARAAVNRIWQAYFGTGLVSSSEDLGVQSEPPSHPELLDWLAVEFMDHGWSRKHIHRLIVTSATYQQSSRVTAELAEKDPANRLLARGPRFRVEGEVVRDIALAASGLLNPKLGGPPVYPPAPEFLFKPPASYGPKVWKEDTGADRYRRAIYTFRFRSVPYPVLTNFDTPNGDSACVRRARSNTPLQALTTLNETLFVEAARALALKTLAEGGVSDNERLAYAFRRCTSREPSDSERKVLGDFLTKQLSRFEQEGAKPWELAASDPAHPPTLPAGATPAQAAAWTATARLLLNLDETITKE